MAAILLPAATIVPAPAAAPTQTIAIPPPRSNAARRGTVSKMLLTMRFVTVPADLDSPNVVAPGLYNWAQPMTVYVIGLVCSILTMRNTDLRSPEQRFIATALAIATVLSAVLYCGQYFCVYQRQLLRMVCLSFDFLFLSIQLTIAHLGACDLFAWEWQKCMGLLSSWIWIHWVMMLDALTPVVRQKLAFNLYFAVPVLILRIVLQFLLLVDVLFWNELGMKDRLLFHGSIAGNDIQVFLMPFVASRVLTNIVWCLRLVWRIRYRNSSDELIMLQGNVEYDCSRRHRRSSRSRGSTVSSAVVGMRNLATTVARKTSRIVPNAGLGRC